MEKEWLTSAQRKQDTEPVQSLYDFTRKPLPKPPSAWLLVPQLAKLAGYAGGFAVVLWLATRTTDAQLEERRRHAADVSNCVDRGIGYHSQFGSYPYFRYGADAGRPAVDVITERCGRTTRAY